MPKVSVIIAAYNRAHLIGRALKTVLEQTYDDFEVIIVDDGSTDNTEDVIKGFDDARIKYIRHDKNKGAAAAWNTGIRASSGEYIAFQDSDDEWVKDKLEKQMDAFSSAPPEVGVVYSAFYEIAENKKTYWPDFFELKQPELDMHDFLLWHYVAITPTTVTRRECFDVAGMFDERIPRFQHWELLLRISKYYKFIFIDEALINNYPQPDSLSSDPQKTEAGWKIVFEKHREDFLKDKKLLVFRYKEMGSLLSKRGHKIYARKYYFSAFMADPLNIRTAPKYLLITVIGSDFYEKARRFLKDFYKKTLSSIKKCLRFLSKSIYIFFKAFAIFLLSVTIGRRRTAGIKDHYKKFFRKKA